ncbi:O-antigen ligase family protein [Suttonella sp. R2A3]|uniref:PglL family O-oligosaccharyltransferase n=1 Tax=Suttonella sp. R2A3 TaxID=2908648 RepID=UPI001F33C303|nr:O-antigen ligase family protein [Suttonella sp. R2A3]UJF23728.1 O-antigen ligase family protein [Suttonella sp. R2A3]
MPHYLLSAFSLTGITLLLVLVLAKTRAAFLPPRLFIFLAASFALLLALSVFNGTFAQYRYQLLIYALAVLCAILLGAQKDTLQFSHQRLLFVIVAGGVLVSLLSLVIFYFPDWVVVQRLAGVVRTRISGPIAQANLLAVTMFVAIGALFELSSQRHMRRMSALVIAWLFGYVMLGTLSRGLLVGFVGYLLLMALLSTKAERRNVRAVFIALLLGAASFWLFNEAIIELLSRFNMVQTVDNHYLDRGSGGITWRFSEWHKAWLLFMDHPWTGVGFERYGAYSVLMYDYPWAVTNNTFPAHSHNIFFQLLAEFGLLGGVFAIMLAGVLMWQLLQVKKYRWFVYALFIAFLMNSLIEYVLWYLSFAVFFAFLWAAFVPQRAAAFRLSHKLLWLVPVVFALLGVITAPLYVVSNQHAYSQTNADKFYEYTANPIYGYDFSSAFLVLFNLDNPYVSEEFLELYRKDLQRMLLIRPTPDIRFKAMQLAVLEGDDAALAEHYQLMRVMVRSNDFLGERYSSFCEPGFIVCEGAYRYIEKHAADQ